VAHLLQAALPPLVVFLPQVLYPPLEPLLLLVALLVLLGLLVKLALKMNCQ
jgi:hypothetical protein